MLPGAVTRRIDAGELESVGGRCADLQSLWKQTCRDSRGRAGIRAASVKSCAGGDFHGVPRRKQLAVEGVAHLEWSRCEVGDEDLHGVPDTGAGAFEVEFVPNHGSGERYVKGTGVAAELREGDIGFGVDDLAGRVDDAQLKA